MNRSFTEWTGHILFRLSMAIIVVASLVVLYVGYLLLWPATPFVAKSTKIDTPVISTTGTLKYDLTYCKYTTSVSTVYRQLVDADSNLAAYGFPSIEGVTKNGCRTQTVLLPMVTGTKPGKYYVSIDLAYPVNPLRVVHVKYSTGTFEVK